MICRIGIQLETTLPQRKLVIYLKNTGLAPTNLYIHDGLVERWQFTAIARGGKRLKVQDKLFYLPCAGLCLSRPAAERLTPRNAQMGLSIRSAILCFARWTKRHARRTAK